MTPWAEVVGHPIGHSLSPMIHRYWLRASGIEGAYEATAVSIPDLPAFLASRCAARGWRGCNVTAPLKQEILPLLDTVDEAAAAVGAVNCVHLEGSRLTGSNTDVDGIREALAGRPIRGQTVAVIGAGGAARAAIHWLQEQGAEAVTLLARRPEAVHELGPRLHAFAIGEADQAFSSASLIINATPLGLDGGEAMSAALLQAVRDARVSAAFDMVYRPIETPFLRAARDGGAQTVDGLTMLIGQARRSFVSFFGSAAPLNQDARLRGLITASTT